MKALIEQQAAAKAGARGAAQAEADTHLDPLQGIDLAPLHRWRKWSSLGYIIVSWG